MKSGVNGLDHRLSFRHRNSTLVKHCHLEKRPLRERNLNGSRKETNKITLATDLPLQPGLEHFYSCCFANSDGDLLHISLLHSKVNRPFALMPFPYFNLTAPLLLDYF